MPAMVGSVFRCRTQGLRALRHSNETLYHYIIPSTYEAKRFMLPSLFKIHLISVSLSRLFNKLPEVLRLSPTNRFERFTYNVILNAGTGAAKQTRQIPPLNGYIYVSFETEFHINNSLETRRNGINAIGRSDTQRCSPQRMKITKWAAV